MFSYFLDYFNMFMAFYYILFFALILVGFVICNKTKFKYRNEMYVLLVFAVLFFLSAFRFDVGFDYFYGYTPHFRSICNMRIKDGLSFSEIMSDHGHFEIGYSLIEYITSLISRHSQSIFIVTSLIFVSLLSLYIYKYFPDKVWGVFLLYGLGFYFCSMNFIRQSIAAFIVVFAIMFAKKKKIIPYMLLVILASSFHKSALIMIPFYFILQIKLTKIVLAGYSVITAIIFIYSEKILNFITSFVYQGYDLSTGSTYTNLGSDWYYIVPAVIYFIVIYIYRDKITKDDPTNNVLVSAAFFNMFCYIISLKHITIDRFSLYFEPAVALALTYLIVELRKEYKEKEKSDKKYKKIFFGRFFTVTSIIVFIVLASNAIQLYDDGHVVTPYQSIFFNEDYELYQKALKNKDWDTVSYYEN